MTRQDPPLRRQALSFAEMRHVEHETGRRDNDFLERKVALIGFRYDRQHYCERVFRQSKRMYGAGNGNSEPDSLQDSQRRPSALDREDRFQIDVVEDAGPGCHEPRKMPSAKVMPAVKAERAGDADFAVCLNRSLGIISNNAGDKFALADRRHMCHILAGTGCGLWRAGRRHRSNRLCISSGAYRQVRCRCG